LLLLKDSLLTTHQVWVKLSTKANVDVLLGFIQSEVPDDAVNVQKLGLELDKLIDDAEERR